MPWTQKQMLRDANGDLIPQYWDVVEQEFKPLTGSDGANDVRVAGSYVGYPTETKPTGKKGETFLELDTLDVYIHDGSGWVKI